MRRMAFLRLVNFALPWGWAGSPRRKPGALGGELSLEARCRRSCAAFRHYAGELRGSEISTGTRGVAQEERPDALRIDVEACAPRFRSFSRSFARRAGQRSLTRLRVCKTGQAPQLRLF